MDDYRVGGVIGYVSDVRRSLQFNGQEIDGGVIRCRVEPSDPLDVFTLVAVWRLRKRKGKRLASVVRNSLDRHSAQVGGAA